MAGHVIPMLSYEDVAQAAAFATSAFGFRETGRWADEQGRLTHVNLEHAGSVIMFGWPGQGYRSPRHHAERCQIERASLETLYVVDGVLVYVDDVDGHFEIARAAGAAILSPLEDNVDVGQRQYRAEDPEGHRWMFAQPL